MNKKTNISCSILSEEPCLLKEPGFALSLVNLFALLIIALLPQPAQAQTSIQSPPPLNLNVWKNGSLALNNQNTKVHFVVDSTWVTVQGTSPEFTGSVSLSDLLDYRTAHGVILFQVAAFDTGLGMRDSHLREVMAASQFPNVKFVLEKLDQFCQATDLLKSRGCSGRVLGTLTIRDISKDIIIPANAEVINSAQSSVSVKITGNSPILWADYHVEDPSNLFAKLDKTVDVFFETTFPLPPDLASE